MSEELRKFLRTPGSQLSINLAGMDEANNEDSIRTDPDRIVWTRPYEGLVQVDPVEIPFAQGILWNPGATAAELYSVEFLVINNDAAGGPITVFMGVDIAAGGVLVIPEYWMFDEVITYPGSSGWRGPFVIAGDDDIRGSASIVNSTSVHWRIRRVDTGA